MSGALEEVMQEDLYDLLKVFEKKSFEAAACEEGSLDDKITKKCESLLKLDYTLMVLDNSDGFLCPRYPSRIFIPECEHGHMTSTLVANNSNILNQSGSNISLQSSLQSNAKSSDASSSSTPTTSDSIHAFVTFANPQVEPLQNTNSESYLQNQQLFMHQTPPTNLTATATSNIPTPKTTSTIYEDSYDLGKIRELVLTSKYARCRQRFVVPVIMFRGKYICRSATISVNAETYGRKAVDTAYNYLNGGNCTERSNPNVDDENNEDTDMNNSSTIQSQFSYEDVIKNDIQLLNALNVNTIVDLMVENRKVKYFLFVSSSEKADPENHYQNFNILSLPYPGCEFFKQFRDNNYMAKNLQYNWDQTFIDATVSIPESGVTADLNIDWNNYKNWDLVMITQNYLLACLKYIQEEKSGMLVHCISGWDRTPLFISLIRLSLWADGLIHKSLNCIQMAYFTLAYDWYLFGHQLPDRSKRGEDIMFFCFHMLKYIADDEFSILENRKRSKTSTSSSNNSVIILKSDSNDEEPLKDDVMYDIDSSESMSMSSLYDVSMTESSVTTFTGSVPSAQGSLNTAANITLTARSPNSKRSRTSPISVPGACARRQRQESTSSNGSWQVVTESGSIESIANGGNMMSQRLDSNNSGHICTSNGCRRYSVNIENVPEKSIRNQRLNNVRTIFIRCYAKAVGLKFQEGSGMTLASLVGNLADQLF